jgi:ATP-binding cassette, subfamily B, multidrug efflux pump
MQSPAPSIGGYLLRYRGRVAFGFLCVLTTIAFSLLTPFILRFAIDGIAGGGAARADLLRYAGLYAAVAAVASVASIGMRKVLLGLSHLVEYDIRGDIFSQLTRLDHAFFQRERTGDIMTKMTSDLSSVRDFVGQGLLQGSRILIGFPMAFAIMFAISVRMALTVLAILPIVSVAFFFLVGLIRRNYDACQEQFSTISNFSQETFAGIRTIKGFGIEDRQRGLFKAHNDEYIRRNMRLARIEEPVWPLMSFTFGVGVVLLLLIGGREVIRGELSLGRFVQFNQYLVYLQWPMLALGWTTNLVQRGLASWGRIRKLLDAVPDVRDGASADHSLARAAGEIVFDHVGIRRDGRALLDDICLRIPEGQCIGITGPTGSGKTLLVSLLVRLFDPTEGVVRIGGRDVRSFPLDVLRRDVGISPQEPFLFSDTLAHNIAFGLAEPQGERILWAAEVAHLRGDIDLFPRKFETLVGERGVTLSGGQRQRTALSRAIAREPAVLILDDVFSAVDTQTEAQILAQLRPVLGRRSSILISHRISTLRHADRIIVIEGGRITQDGTHEDLASRPGYYRELDEIQRLEARLEES